MAYYRYSNSYPGKDGEITVRSMTPIAPQAEHSSYFVHRCYTSEKDDSSYYYVVSLGHEKSWPQKEIVNRNCDRFIIHYVLRGCGEFQGKPVHAGQFFFTHPYEVHTIRADEKDPMEFYYIGTAGPGVEDLMRRSGFFSIPSIQDFHFTEQIAPAFFDALYCMHDENDTELYFLSLLLRLLSLHQKEKVRSATENSKMHAFLYYKEALILIQTYLTEGITPKDIAQHLHVSPSYLRAIFSRFCKYSVQELIIRKRIECAANRLTFENESVAQVAAAVGYSDYTLFSKIFKKYTGMSPQTYKKRHCQISVLTENIHEELPPSESRPPEAVADKKDPCQNATAPAKKDRSDR